MMEFLFFTAANTPIFTRSDAEEAEWTVEEYQLRTQWPYDPDKVITNGMRMAFLYDGVWQTFEVFRVKNQEPDHSQDVTAEHIAIAELNDEHFPQTDITNKTAGEALAQILDGTLWSVGDNTSSGTSSVNLGMGNVWQDVRSIESNWNVYITPRVTMGASGITGRYLDITPAESTWRGVRLSINKNIQEAGITYDDSGIKTAVYGYGKGVENAGGESEPLTFGEAVWTATADHPAKPDGQTYLEDPTATAAYGRNGRARYGFYQNANIGDAETLLEKTWEYLKTVNKPQVTIDCVVSDLKRLGYADQIIKLHDAAIVEIEPIGAKLVLEIVKLLVNLLDASQTRPTIGSYIPNIVYIERETAERASGGGGGGGGQTDLEYRIKEFETEIGWNDYQISLRAYQRDMSNVENILKESGVAIAAGGTIIYANNNLDNMKSSIQVNAGAIAAEVTRAQNAESGLGARITLTENSLSSKISTKATVYPQFNDPAEVSGNTVQDGDIWEKTNGIETWGDIAALTYNEAGAYAWRDEMGTTQYVRKNGKWVMSTDQPIVVEGSTEILQTAKQVGFLANSVTELNGQIERNSASLIVEADRITALVEKTGVNSLGQNETLYSKVQQTATEVSSKVSAGDIASTINQTAQSVLIQANKINLQGYVTASELSAELASLETAIASGIITEAFQADDAYITRLQVSGTNVAWLTQYVITGINTKTVTFIDADDVQHTLNVFQNNSAYTGTTIYYLGRAAA